MNTAPLPEREQIALLEPFEGLGPRDIRVVATLQEAQAAAAALLAAGVAGFDTESKPTFAKNEVSGGPHVVQFATLREAWLFQLHRTECWETLAALLASTALAKVGFGLSTDLSLIRQRLGIEPRAVFDIDTEFRRRGYRKSVGVKTAVALVFNRRFVKSRKATTSNWANRQLTEAQIRYAANDAYAAMRVFDALALAVPDSFSGLPAPRRGP
jgi:ribonuclease D